MKGIRARTASALVVGLLAAAGCSSQGDETEWVEVGVRVLGLSEDEMTMLVDLETCPLQGEGGVARVFVDEDSDEVRVLARAADPTDQLDCGYSEEVGLVDPLGSRPVIDEFDGVEEVVPAPGT